MLCRPAFAFAWDRAGVLAEEAFVAEASTAMVSAIRAKQAVEGASPQQPRANMVAIAAVFAVAARAAAVRELAAAEVRARVAEATATIWVERFRGAAAAIRGRLAAEAAGPSEAPS